MKIFKRTVIIGIILALPLQALSGTTRPPAQPKPADKTVKTIPVYKPPLRGAPAGRIGGGTRGISERESFSLQVLAPDHVGNTTQEQPCLYWFISKSTGYPIELTVTERKAVQPLLEKTLTAPGESGIQSACLGDYGVKLRKNVQYKWFVTLVIDPERRSKDIMAGGMLTVVEQPPSLVEKLKAADKNSLPDIYAEEGLWYDAIDSVSKMLDASPGNNGLRKWRSSILEQVGLVEVATHENHQGQ
jgi:hypothetical protein